MNNVLTETNYTMLTPKTVVSKCVASTVAKNQPAFYLLPKDSFKPQYTTQQRHYLNLYNQAWKDSGLPKNLKPRVVFKDLRNDKIFFAYSFIKGYIVLPKSDESLEAITKKGQEKFFLAHECRHAKQTFNIARLYGSDKLKEILLKKSHGYSEREYIEDFFNKKYYDRAIKVMGKIDIHSAEGREAVRFAKALEKYNGISQYYNKYKEAPRQSKLFYYIRYKKAIWDYHHNLLEIDANRAAKKLKPTKTLAAKFFTLANFNKIAKRLKRF